MPPSIGVLDKRSADSHDPPHQSRSNNSTSVLAKRGKASTNDASVARLLTDPVQSSVGFRRTKFAEDDFDRTLRDQEQQKTVCKVPNSLLRFGRAKSLNRDLNQHTSASGHDAYSLSVMDRTALATSRTKSTHTNPNIPSKNAARIERTGSKLPMYHARLTFVPPHRDETFGGAVSSQKLPTHRDETIGGARSNQKLHTHRDETIGGARSSQKLPTHRDETIGGARSSQKFNTITEEKYLDDVSSLGSGNLINNNMETIKPLLPSEFSIAANENGNRITSKEINTKNICNGTACSHAPIGCGVDCRKVKTCDSAKELRCAYSKKNSRNLKTYSIANALRSTMTTGQIIEKYSLNSKSCQGNPSISELETRPSLQTSVVHSRAPKAVTPNNESKLSVLPSGVFDSSYNCAVHSLDDDYLTDIVSANDVNFRRPGELSSELSRSDTDAFLSLVNQRKDALKIEELNKEINKKSLSNIIIEDILAKDRRERLFSSIAEDHLSSKQHTTSQPCPQVSDISQEQATESQPDSNRHEIIEMKEFPNQQGGYQNYPPDNKPRWVFEEIEKLVNSKRVRLPEKQVCISVTSTKIPQCFQQSNTEEHKSNRVPLYDLPKPKVQLCNSQPRLSLPMEENLQSKASNPHEFRHQSSEKCQMNLTVTALCTEETDREKTRPEAHKTEQQSKSRGPPKVIGIEMKVPSVRHAVVTPVSRKLIKKISPSRLSRFERTLSSSKNLRSSKNGSCHGRNFFSPKTCLRNICPCPRCSQNVSLLESAILYHTGNSPHARSEDVVVASSLNQYIGLLFSGLDSNNTGFITEEQFRALMRTLGCETNISSGKTLKISLVDFPKRLWQCWSQNHSQATYQDKPKTRKPLLESILSSKSDIESMENLSGQLEDINTSMKTVSSSDSNEYSYIGQGLGHRLWQNKQRDLARSKENRCLKSTLRDLRSALLRIGVENLILKVKILLESPGSSCNLLSTDGFLDVQHGGKVLECKVHGNGDECTKCRKHKCPNVHLNSLGTEQKLNSPSDPKMTSSEEGSDTKFHHESPEWKSKIKSDDNLCKNYLTMNGYQESPTQLSEYMYVNQARQLYEDNSLYCSINNDDQYEHMTMKTNMNLRLKNEKMQCSLNDSDKEEEVSSLESDAKSNPQRIRSYGSRSKARVSFSTRSSRSSKIRRTTVTLRHMSDYAPPPLPRRRYVNQPKTPHNQDSSISPYQTSTTSFGSSLSEMGTEIPYDASTPIRSENLSFSQLKNSTGTMQKPEIQFDRPQHNYSTSKQISQTFVSSTQSTSKTLSEKLTHLDATNEQVEKYEQSLEGVTGAPECLAVDVPDSDLPRGAHASSRTNLKNLLSLNTPRKISTGQDPKTLKKTRLGKNRARALPELLATRARLLEALSVVRGKEGSPAVKEASVATQFELKPKGDTGDHAPETFSLDNGNSTKSPSASQMGKPSLEKKGAEFIQEDNISLGEDESEETNQGPLEETKIRVEDVRSSVLEKEEEFKSLVSTIESSLVISSGRKRPHNPRGSSRRRERNVPLPVITENVEVKPNVRLSLKLYENLRRDNLNISEDSTDEAASENNDLTVDDILAEVMTYCRENGVPIKETRCFNECEFKDESEPCYVNPSNLKSVHTSDSDVKHGVNSKSCASYKKNSPVGAPHTTHTQNWKQQHHHNLQQPSPQLALTSNTTDITNVTNMGCPKSSIYCDHPLEDKSCSVGGFETELDKHVQVEKEVDEQEDDGSVLLDDGCNSSCSSGSDSGRGESETSCPTPEEHLSCNSGGSDDGMWTSEDYSCLNHMISGSDCHSQPVSYPAGLSSCDKTKTISEQAEQNITQNLPQNLHSITRSLDASEHFSTHNECGQVFDNSFGNAKSYSHDAETLLEETQYENHHEDLRNPGPKTKRSEILAILFEDYDNVDNCLNTDTPRLEQTPELEIIDLDEEQPSEQQSIRKDERMKSKNFFGRRCNSFSSFRSFISSTTSHLKRNGPSRSSFSSSKSLPNYFSGTKAVPDLTPYSGTQLKSIYKSDATRLGSNLKKNSSKRISFSDTIDVYPEGSTFQVNTEGKRCHRYPAGLEIPEYSPRTSSQVSSEDDRKESHFELQRDDGITDQVETRKTEHRNEISPVIQYNDISSHESVTLSTRNSIDFNDILLSLTEFNNEVKKTNFIPSHPITHFVNIRNISKPVSKITETQALESIDQASSPYSIKRLPDATKVSSSSNVWDFSPSRHNHYDDDTDAKQNDGLAIAPAAPRKSETPRSVGSGQALLKALELELEDVLRSLEDEETELE